MSKPRRIIQIAINSRPTGGGVVYAVGDDGTAWEYYEQERKWWQLPALPNASDAPSKQEVKP